jgi:pantothenate kinase type III
MNRTGYLKIGNSSVKILQSEKISILNNIKELSSLKLDTLIYYSTASTKEFSILKKCGIPIIKRVTNHDRFAVKNGYRKKEELGVDRLLGSSYFYRKYKKDFVYIDLGTAITVNFIKNGMLIGGYIILNIEKYIEAISTIGKLPKIDIDKFNDTIGKTTSENILNGIGLMYKAFFDKIKNRHLLFVSGGNERLLDIIDYDDYTENADLLELMNYEA